jgi:hypothetical protein
MAAACTRALQERWEAEHQQQASQLQQMLAAQQQLMAAQQEQLAAQQLLLREVRCMRQLDPGSTHKTPAAATAAAAGRQLLDTPLLVPTPAPGAAGATEATAAATAAAAIHAAASGGSDSSSGGGAGEGREGAPEVSMHRLQSAISLGPGEVTAGEATAQEVEALLGRISSAGLLAWLSVQPHAAPGGEGVCPSAIVEAFLAGVCCPPAGGGSIDPPAAVAPKLRSAAAAKLGACLSELADATDVYATGGSKACGQGCMADQGVMFHVL